MRSTSTATGALDLEATGGGPRLSGAATVLRRTLEGDFKSSRAAAEAHRGVRATASRTPFSYRHISPFRRRRRIDYFPTRTAQIRVKVVLFILHDDDVERENGQESWEILNPSQKPPSISPYLLMWSSPDKKGYAQSPTRDNVVQNYRNKGVEQVRNLNF